MHFTRIFLPTISYAPKVSIGITYIPSERRLRAIVPLPSNIDDFRGINRSEGSLNAISFSKVHRREARCISNFENTGAISQGSQGIIVGVIKCVRHTYTAIIKAEGSVFYE